MLRVRTATLNDIRGIVEAHCSDIAEWFKWRDGRRVRARYEELSVEEKYDHGGPWMGVETCAIHLNYLLLSEQHPLVVEEDDKIVGELELYVGREPEPYGLNAHIDVLVIHDSYRGKGCGRKLVAHAVELAKQLGCDTITVWPEQGSEGFYEKCGMKLVFSKRIEVAVDLSSIEGTQKAEVKREELGEYSPLEDKVMYFGRYQSSFAQWLKRRWGFHFEEVKQLQIEGKVEELDAYFILESRWRKEDECVLMLWARSCIDAAAACRSVLSLAKELGFRKAVTLVEQRHLECLKGLKYEKLGESVILGTRLR